MFLSSNVKMSSCCFSSFLLENNEVNSKQCQSPTFALSFAYDQYHGEVIHLFFFLSYSKENQKNKDKKQINRKENM